MSDRIVINSITQAHKLMEIESPVHPLISVFRHTPEMNKDIGDVKINMELYFISMKDGIHGKFHYGRKSYDFEEGTMMFIAPSQIMRVDESVTDIDSRGWSILIHPDLIRKSHLGQMMEDYSFFNYEVNEALHLSDKEKNALTELVHKIEEEINQNMDKHTQALIISNLELLLNYCTRYYDRQFYTRSNVNKDWVAKFDSLLKAYFKENKQLETGIPTVKYCSNEIGMSSSYLSDLLKKETGRNAQDHIHNFVIEKAKTILLNSNETVSQISYGLGFEYSQHFSKLFKAKVGMSPKQYRTTLN